MKDKKEFKAEVKAILAECNTKRESDLMAEEMKETIDDVLKEFENK